MERIFCYGNASSKCGTVPRLCCLRNHQIFIEISIYCYNKNTTDNCGICRIYWNVIDSGALGRKNGFLLFVSAFCIYYSLFQWTNLFRANLFQPNFYKNGKIQPATVFEPYYMGQAVIHAEYADFFSKRAGYLFGAFFCIRFCLRQYNRIYKRIGKKVWFTDKKMFC